MLLKISIIRISRMIARMIITRIIITRIIVEMIVEMIVERMVTTGMIAMMAAVGIIQLEGIDFSGMGHRVPQGNYFVHQHRHQ
jgi:hypothetical protein